MLWPQCATCRMKCRNPPIVFTRICSPQAKSTSTRIRSHRPVACMMQQMTLVVCKLITTRLSVAKCQYCPGYRKITLTIANLVTSTYLLHGITETTELTKKLFLNSIFNEVLLRTVCQVLSQTHSQRIKGMNVYGNNFKQCMCLCSVLSV